MPPHWLWVLLLYILVVVPSVFHAAFYKRHSRAALGWIAFILTAPVVGGLCYFVFGLNRVRVSSRRRRSQASAALSALEGVASEERARREHGAESLAGFSHAERAMVRVGHALTDSPLVGGNSVWPLRNGEEAYPVMLAAIEHAKERVWLTSYIFDVDPPGLIFVDALIRAHRRGVDVRVLVDGVGQLSGVGVSRSGGRVRIEALPVSARLKAAGVPVVRFLPPRVLPPSWYINMRNHRKVLVVDGRVAFSGGMNIGGRHLVDDPWNTTPVQDLHFRLKGPIVRDLEWLFLHDWAFAVHHEPRRRSSLPQVTLHPQLSWPPEDDRVSSEDEIALELEERRRIIGDALRIPASETRRDRVALSGLSPSRAHYLISRLSELPRVDREVGDAWCRLVPDGPDESLNRLEMLIAGVVGASESSVLLVTPYFLPTDMLTSAFAAAALRGVEVRVLIPMKSNEPLVEHAMYRMVHWLLQRGVKVRRVPAPFMHTKLLVVDDRYVQMGTTNIDPRSLRLNFEHVVEIYSAALASQLLAHYDDVWVRAEELTEVTIAARPWYVRGADAFCWLFSPYL